MNTAAVATPVVALPAIGAAFHGGIFAGITLHEDKLHALILLPEESGRLEWPDAIEFAAKQDGELPSRIDALILFKNLRKEFRSSDWYWTGEENPVDAGYAFIQGFGNGYQLDDRKDGDYRARAVRRVSI